MSFTFVLKLGLLVLFGFNLIASMLLLNGVVDGRGLVGSETDTLLKFTGLTNPDILP